MLIIKDEIIVKTIKTKKDVIKGKSFKKMK